MLQNKLYATREAAARAMMGDVTRVECPATGLVYNQAFHPSWLDYDSDYQNEQAQRFTRLAALPVLAPGTARPGLKGVDVFIRHPINSEEIQAVTGASDVNWIAVA